MVRLSSGTSTATVLFLSILASSWVGRICTLAEGDEENLLKLAKANNHIAFSLLRKLSPSDGNVFFSPLSLSIAFSMLSYGAREETLKDLRKTFGYEDVELSESLVHKTFHQLLTEFLSSSDPNSYIFNSANAILLDERLDVDKGYRRRVQDIYQASVKIIDFLTEGTQAMKEINRWVKDKTNGKIDKLLDDLHPSTILILLNAVYFKGNWKTQFDPRRTRPQTFYNNGQEGHARNVPMMRLIEKFLYTETSCSSQAIELPYKGENISMLILLPKKRDGLNSLIECLTVEKLTTIRSKLLKTRINLTLPKFMVKYSKEMSDDFKSLGVESIFVPQADFSGITANKNIYVSQVLHKAVVDVNEEGSEAAAISAIIQHVSVPILDIKFTANHPFIFAIVDKRTDMILFLGYITSL